MDWVALKEKGNEEFKKQNYKEAMDYYTKAIGNIKSIIITLEIKPDEDTLHSNKGTCNKNIGKYKLAIKDFQSALQINPRNTKNLKRVSTVYIIIGNFGEASIVLQKCVNLEPKDPSHRNELEKVETMIKKFDSIPEYKQKEDWPRVEEICESLLKDATAFATLKLEYIQALLNNVKITETLRWIMTNVTLEDKQSDIEFEYLIALALYYEGAYEKAKKQMAILLTKAEANEKYSKLLNQIKTIEKTKTEANKIFKEGKYEEAINEYTKLLEFDPSNRKFNAVIYVNRSICYKKLNKNTEALQDANKGIQANPNYVNGYLKRGTIYNELKMYEEAKYDFQKVKDLDSNNSEIHSMLENAKANEKKAKKRDYYKILELDRNANEVEIKKQYRKLAGLHHPDRNNESEETKKMAEKKFINVNDAYNVLSDPKKKQMFDQGVDPLNPEEAQSSGMNFNGFDQGDILNMFFSQGFGQRSSGGRSGRTGGQRAGGFEFFFQ